MTPFPRDDYRELKRYHFDRTPVALDLSDNTNQWGAHPDALRVLSEASGDGLARYPELYADTLRDSVAQRLGVDADCVTTGCGSDDVLDSIYRATRTSESDFISTATPTFSMVLPLARMNGMGARTLPWAEALEDPRRLLEGGPALVYVCRPNNPTGHVAPRAWLDALVAEAGADGPIILVDEAYVDFADESYVDAAVTQPRVVVSRTLSKAFGLAGLRVGYAVGMPETVLEFEKSRGPYKVGRAAVAAASAALRDQDGWVDRTVAECLENRDRLATELANRGLEPQPSRANFILFRSLTGDAQADALSLRHRGVAVRPFAGAWEDGSDALRVTVAPWAMLQDFLTALDQVIAS